MASNPAATDRFNAADGCDSARQLRRLQPPSSGKGDGGVGVLERRKRLAERWGRSTLLACPCVSRSLADSVKGRHKDGSERNAGLAGSSVLNTSGSGAVGPGIGDRPAGGPGGRGAGWWSGENGRERAESWHRGCCSCWALLVWRGRVVMACCSNRRGREEEAAPFREGLN